MAHSSESHGTYDLNIERAEASRPTPVAAAPVVEAADEAREWLIRKDGYFYRPNCQGYTTRKIEAGRYTKAEAESEAAVEPWHMKAIHESEWPDEPAVVALNETVTALQSQVQALQGENEELRRKLFPHADANPICGFSYSGFYFISDKKGIAEFRRLENNANQIATWRRSFDENIAAYKAKTEAAEAQVQSLTQKLAERDRLERAIEFVASMCWRTDPPNANAPFTEAERFSAIKHHPTIKRFSAGHIELAEREARSLQSKGNEHA